MTAASIPKVVAVAAVAGASGAVIDATGVETLSPALPRSHIV